MSLVADFITLLAALPERPDFWSFVCIPVVAGLVGWFTNWLAIQMTFHPLEFRGIRPWLGWQGIVPRKADKMSGRMVDDILSRLGTLSEIFHEMEPEKIAAHMARMLSARVEDYVDDIMGEHYRVVWENLPLMVRRRVYARVRKALPALMDNLVEDIGDNIDELIDLRGMVVELLRQDRHLMVRLFQDVGRQELEFVVRSGFTFGLLFGLVQMVLWYVWPRPVLMPLFGFVVGYATNWLALNLIFRPLRPVRLGPWTMHGLFLRRQPEVAEAFAALVTHEILTVQHIMASLLMGPKAERTRVLVKKHLRPLLEGGVTRTAIQLALGVEGYAGIKRILVDKTAGLSLAPLQDASFNHERSRNIEKLLCERMQALDSAEFQDLLRPAFKEDEWILIILGAVLGTIAGSLQLLLMFQV